MSDPILDADIRNKDAAYNLVVLQSAELEQAATDWYRRDTGREPARSDIQHMVYWRMVDERLRWGTPRAAWRNEHPNGAPPTDTPVIDPFGALGIQGKFWTRNGQDVALVDTSEFSLFQRYLDGEDILPVVLERHGLGFNSRRVWLLNQSVVGFRNATPDAGIHPAHDPQFYTKLRAFCELLNTAGSVAHLTVFTQTRLLMPTATEQQRHLDATADAVRGLGNVVLSLANEIEAGNEYDVAILDQLRRPSGVLISRGSNGSEAIQPHIEAPWDFGEFHTNDAFEWQRKTGHNAMEQADENKVPCWPTENTRCPDRDGNPVHHEDAAENAILLAGAYTFHSQGGKFSRPFDAAETECAQACQRGASQVSIEFVRGAYSHPVELEIPGVIRVHRRTLPDGRFYDCYVRA